MRSTLIRVTLLVVPALALAFFASREAHAHALGFESDLSADEHIVWCNPAGIEAERVRRAVGAWNARTDGLGEGPLFVEYGTGTPLVCEVEVSLAADERVLGQVVFATDPDQLQINAQTLRRLDTEKQRQRVVSHEFGHTLGLAHARRVLCRRSVMPTTRSCIRSGKRYRAYSGLHDQADLFDYWVDTPNYPIPNKCPTGECPASSGRTETPTKVVEYVRDW
jgi:hypothetical protein